MTVDNNSLQLLCGNLPHVIFVLWMKIIECNPFNDPRFLRMKWMPHIQVRFFVPNYFSAWHGNEFYRDTQDVLKDMGLNLIFWTSFLFYSIGWFCNRLIDELKISRCSGLWAFYLSYLKKLKTAKLQSFCESHVLTFKFRKIFMSKNQPQIFIRCSQKSKFSSC